MTREAIQQCAAEIASSQLAVGCGCDECAKRIEAILTHFAAEGDGDNTPTIAGQPARFVPDDQGGHIEFNGKVWRPER